MKVTPIPCLSDNYAYLLECERSGEAAVVDASEAGPVIEALRARSRRSLAAIYATHHHFDHVGGNDELARAMGAREVVGHASDQGRIPGQTRLVEVGDTLVLGVLRVCVLHLPGHTLGAVAYHVTEGADDAGGVVFTGDTLFLAGCGRLFEGTPPMMHASLAKLAALPPTTRVFCGHEYTQSNLRFAAHVEPGNAAIADRARRAVELRSAGAPTVPGTVADELATNPFLRVRSPEIRRTLAIPDDADDGAALGAIRKAKDQFR